MTDPRTVDEIYDSLKNNLEGKISDLTNFTETSFNYVWAQAFSEEFRESEIDNAAAYLEGFVDYAGGDVDEEDLRELDLEADVSVEEINERLEDKNLNELVKLVGVTRDPGEEATGTVTFTTQSSFTKIPSGTSVGTQPDSSGDFLEFVTTEDVSTANGTTTTDAEIVATDVGTEYNVGSATITYLPDPPAGIQSVTNSSATTNGEDEESNQELRERAKQAIFQTSGGGTVQGVIGFIESEVDGVTEVNIEEFHTGDSWHGNYPHGHVIVDGGSDEDVIDAIAESRPASVEHVLVRPSVFLIAADIDLTGSSIDTAEVEERVKEYLNEIGLGEEAVYNKIIQQVLNADDDINDVDVLDLSVENESHSFNQETIDDFEDNDISIVNRNWNDWAGDTGSFSAQSGTVLSESYSGELSSSNASVAVSTTKSSGSTTMHFESGVQIDTQTGNSSDDVSLEFLSSNTSLGALEFRGNGNVVFSGGSDTTITTWSTATEYTPVLQFDFDNDTVDVTVDGSTSTGLNLSNSVSGWDEVSFGNDTTNSGGTVAAYIDDIYLMEDVYALGLGDEMVSDGITEVTGTLNGSSHTFTEGTDYNEHVIGSGDDSIQWILSGDRPDIERDRTTTITYDSNRDEYRVDSQLIDEGVTKVEDAAGTVYTEGTDWEEKDLSNDDRDDSIEWLGASTPADGADVTITYDAGTLADVDYDIDDADIVVGADEKVDAGTITTTVL